jgi:hypothetical protein
LHTHFFVATCGKKMLHTHFFAGTSGEKMLHVHYIPASILLCQRTHRVQPPPLWGGGQGGEVFCQKSNYYK